MKDDKKVGGDQIIFTFLLCMIAPVVMWIMYAYLFGKAEGEGEETSKLEWASLIIPIILWCYLVGRTF